MKLQTESPHIIRIIGRSNEMLVTINNDGSLTYGDGYTPDEAAQIFWEAVGCKFKDSTK